MRTIRIEGALAPAPDSLRDRTILLVGAAGGLGRVAAPSIAAAGACVVLLGRKVPALERLYDELVALGAPTPAIYPLDLAGATAADYAAMAQSIERECGRLDGVLFAAAQFPALTAFDLTPADDWLRALQVNLAAPGLILGASLPLLKRAPDASIVFVLEDAGRVGRAYWGGYGVAKQAQAALAAMLADELENSRVRVHGLLPAPMRTALRARAYVADRDPSAESPQRAAAAAAHLLTTEAAALRGCVLDLRPTSAET
jgi:NAD(P)-dependent dehydrogenase (short-subunit alcohol dehydrogenase family)